MIYLYDANIEKDEMCQGRPLWSIVACNYYRVFCVHLPEIVSH